MIMAEKVTSFAVGNDHKETTGHLKLLSLFARELGNDEVVRELQSKSRGSEGPLMKLQRQHIVDIF